MRHGNKIRTSVIVPSSAERAIVTISAPVSRPFMFATRDSRASVRPQRKTVSKRSQVGAVNHTSTSFQPRCGYGICPAGSAGHAVVNGGRAQDTARAVLSHTGPKRPLGSTVGIAHADWRLVIADRPVTPITEIEKSPRKSLRDAPTTVSGHLRTETC
jgi:hypothetical protein